MIIDWWNDGSIIGCSVWLSIGGEMGDCQ